MMVIQYGETKEKRRHGRPMSSWQSQLSLQSSPSVTLLPPSLIVIVVLISYLQSVKWANRLAAMHGALSIGASIFLLIIWAISVGIFNIHDHSSTTSDLWSWSCNEAESSEYQGVNWSQYCLEQVCLTFVPPDLW